MIWEATQDDVPEIVDMIVDLRAAVEGPFEVDREHAAFVVLVMIGNPNALVLRSARGFIAGEIAHTIVSPLPVAQERGWHAKDGQGIPLLDQWLAWAKEQGATAVQLSTSADPRPTLRSALKRRGFRPAEMGWVA